MINCIREEVCILMHCAHLVYYFSIISNRSYGVVLWEITSYGDAPLDDMEAKDIVEAAQDGTLQHSRL